MLTLAAFVLEKFGGDTIDDVRGEPDALPGADRAHTRGPGRRAAGGPARSRPVRDDGAPAHGLTGTDEAGSGGDD